MNPEQLKAMYRRQVENGEVVVVRRVTGSGVNRPFFDAPARAKVADYRIEELAGTIAQGDRKVILLAEDLGAAQWPQPIKVDDLVFIGGRPAQVKGVDDRTRRVGGVLIAYELQVRGH